MCTCGINYAVHHARDYKMAEESVSCPEPLIYSRGGDSEVLEEHIVSICTHPSRDLLAVGDIVGKITLYVR